MLLETSVRRKLERAEITKPIILTMHSQNCSDALFCCTILPIIWVLFYACGQPSLIVDRRGKEGRLFSMQIHDFHYL